LQPKSITRRFGALRAAGALLAAALLGVPAAARQADGPGAGWRPAPAQLALFTPARHRAAYQAFTSREPLDRALADLLARVPAVRAPGSWEPDRVAAADAFGSGGRYDRWQLVRLYGARTPQVARGAVIRNGGSIESWTLISPYPDAGLRRLDPGTLLLVLRIP
jgi:hypothetical protein